MSHSTQDHGSGHTWTDVRIVPLTRSEDTSIAQSHWIKRTATGEQASTVSECVGILCSAFSFGGGITEGKDDWLFIQASHGLDHIVGEQSSSSGHPNDGGGLDCVDCI